MKIIGTGSAVPAFTVTNEMLEQFLDTSDEWITERTGIKSRQLMTTERLDDLGVLAAQRALESAGLQPTDIDMIILSNVINEYMTPSLSSLIQGRIGATCPCLDINAACAGFIYALDVAEAMLKNGHERILVLAVEAPTLMVDWKARETCVLFGDGAGAVVVTQGDNLKAMRLTTVSKPKPLFGYRAVSKSPWDRKTEPDYYMKMEGREVFRIAVNSSLKDIKAVLASCQLQADQVDYYLLHQANLRIMDSIRKMLDVAPGKFPHNIEKRGNTSSASVAILLDEMNREGKIKQGDKLVLSAFGAGFCTAACLIEW